MGKGVVSDLSSEMPSDRVPPGRHYFEGSFRIPMTGRRFLLTAKAPDRSPMTVAFGVLALAVVSLTVPAILALLANWVSLPMWVVLADAAAFAVTMSCATRFAPWYRHGNVRISDLTKSDGDPTARANIFIHHQDGDPHHQFEACSGQATWTAVTWDTPSRSLPGLKSAFLILAAAVLIPAAALIGVAALVHAPVPEAVISALLGATVCAACAIVAMIRIEQIERAAPKTADIEVRGAG